MNAATTLRELVEELERLIGEANDADRELRYVVFGDKEPLVEQLSSANTELATEVRNSGPRLLAVCKAALEVGHEYGEASIFTFEGEGHPLELALISLRAAIEGASHDGSE